MSEASAKALLATLGQSSVQRVFLEVEVTGEMDLDNPPPPPSAAVRRLMTAMDAVCLTNVLQRVQRDDGFVTGIDMTLVGELGDLEAVSRLAAALHGNTHVTRINLDQMKPDEGGSETSTTSAAVTAALQALVPAIRWGGSNVNEVNFGLFTVVSDGVRSELIGACLANELRPVIDDDKSSEDLAIYSAGDEHMPAVASALVGNTNLQTIGFYADGPGRATPITAAGVRTLLPALKDCNVWGITLEGAEKIPQGPDDEDAISLHVEMGDACFANALRLIRADEPDRTAMSFFYTHLRDEHMAALGDALAQNSSLRDLDFSGCHLLSAAGVMALGAAQVPHSQARDMVGSAYAGARAVGGAAVADSFTNLGQHFGEEPTSAGAVCRRVVAGSQLG